MPSLAVPRAVEPARLLTLHPTLRGAVVLDGSGPHSWGHGMAMLTAEPRATLAVYAHGNARITIGSRDSDVPAQHTVTGDPFKLWQRFLDETPALLRVNGDRDAAGFVTLLGYDLKHWVESLPRRQPWPSYPLLYCAFYDWVYRYDYRTWSGVLHAQSTEQIERVLARYFDGASVESAPAQFTWERLRPECNHQRYRERIAAIHRYIADGDVYQVNFAHAFAASAPAHAAPTLFARIQHEYPVPFAGYVDAGDVIAASASPECFLVVQGDAISTFPIKGTRALDEPVGHLRDDPKEWAEHVMIVDLERNDLGRICRTGSVEVADFGSVHTYPFLAHMISEVRGRLRPNISLAEIMKATFPGGSITGAPKIRAMQIIEELELGPRGLYTGAIGWTDLDGASRFNLAIRTAVFAADRVRYHAGGGIVADSDAEREYQETLLKSASFQRTIAAL